MREVLNMNTDAALWADWGDSTGVLIAVVCVAAAVLACGVIWLRHHLTRRRVTTRFADFKQRVMQLRERVEAVKERHRLLPASDQDFQQAMTGKTLALYNQIQQDVGRLWDNWLERMDVWERVQKLIEAARFPGVRGLKEAGRLLDKLGSFDEVGRACQGCASGLDQLEQDHEQALKMLGQAEERPGQLREPIEAVARLPLPTAPYEAELTACAALTEQARQLLPSDPIGAQAVLADSLRKLDALAERLGEVVQLFQQARRPATRWRKSPIWRPNAERRGCCWSSRTVTRIRCWSRAGHSTPQCCKRWIVATRRRQPGIEIRPWPRPSKPRPRLIGKWLPASRPRAKSPPAGPRRKACSGR